MDASIGLSRHGSLGRLKGVPLVQADQVRLERVVSTLITNALKCSLSDSEVTQALERVAGEVQFSVSDHGRRHSS
jgi:signal transduction histidine kinase